MPTKTRGGSAGTRSIGGERCSSRGACIGSCAAVSALQSDHSAAFAATEAAHSQALAAQNEKLVQLGQDLSGIQEKSLKDMDQHSTVAAERQRILESRIESESATIAKLERARKDTSQQVESWQSS